MDHKILASEILEAIGGKENLASAAHCATRLRLVIADNSKVKKSDLENFDGVKGVFEASGQLQLILGTGVVNKVYAEFILLAGIEAASKEDVKKEYQVPRKTKPRYEEGWHNYDYDAIEKRALAKSYGIKLGDNDEQ